MSSRDKKAASNPQEKLSEKQEAEESSKDPGQIIKEYKEAKRRLSKTTLKKEKSTSEKALLSSPVNTQHIEATTGGGDKKYDFTLSNHQALDAIRSNKIDEREEIEQEEWPESKKQGKGKPLESKTQRVPLSDFPVDDYPAKGF